MAPENVRKLMGGWAAGTLTESERKALLEAALEDQDLFNEMMAEQPLKDLLDDPAAHAELLAAATPSRRGFWAWLARPWPMAAAGATVATAIILGIAISQREPEHRTVAEVAVQRPPAPASAAEPPREPKQLAKSKAVAPRQFTPPPAANKPKLEIAPPAPLAAGNAGVVGGVPGGVVGGVPGGTPGGVIGGIVPSLQRAAAPPPPPPPPPREAARKDVQLRTLDVPAPAAAGFRASLAQRADSAAQVPTQGLTYRILKRTDQNEFREVQAGSAFAPGDAVVISVNVPQAGFLQLFEAAKPLSALIPVQAGQVYTFPQQGSIELTGDAKERTLTLRFIQAALTAPVNIPVTLKIQ